jgi:hypothetical protein
LSEGFPLFFIYLLLNPSHNQSDNTLDLFRIQSPALLDSMPFLYAFPATGGGCMLGDKCRMTSHRRLFAIILRKSRCDPVFYKLIGKKVDVEVDCWRLTYGMDFLSSFHPIPLVWGHMILP